jgi:DNA polymerase-3 subunit gamma/tau
MTDKAPGYQVLARKYRPATFDELIGQEPIVRTLRNAFAAGRIPHAWMLTGVRGVGKTTTARILARALNYADEGGAGGPNIDLPEEGLHCRAILEGRHPDVIEMDAASHTGIDDIREVIDSARYSPVSARYKVYIVDEVHMLSKQAFNGLLKTLEEPPAHVKFVFATTEIRKVPVTVLSRCQRFDLRRVDAVVLIGQLASIAGRENVEVEPEALRLIAAEGSVRDALSILDQAIAHGAGKVDADSVQHMLGFADRLRIVDLFQRVMRGETAAALAEIDAQHRIGADPAQVLTDLAEFVHYVTRLKVAPEAAANAAVSETERRRGQEFAKELTLRALARAWQMLLKGITEVAEAARPSLAADMVLVRLCHAADLPTPDEALKLLADTPAEAGKAPPVRQRAPTGGRGSAAELRQPEADARPEPAPPSLASFGDVVARARAERDQTLVFALERQVRLIRFEPGRVEIAPTADAAPDLAQRLGRALMDWTGERWLVAIGNRSAEPTLHEARQASRAALFEEAGADPLVRQVLERFPGAEIVGVRPRSPDKDRAPAEPRAGEDEG